MDGVLVGASVGALLAYGLLMQSRRRAWEEAARQREAELFSRKLKLGAQASMKS